MDTEKARIFLTVIEERSLSAAAAKLGYTTSGISRSIASLEEELGLTLFFRGKKGAELTNDAKTIVSIMRELVYQADRIREATEMLHGLESGTVTIGISYAGYFKLISDGLKSFLNRYPRIKIKTLQATSTELLGAIENHDIDLAIMTYRDSGYNFEVLRKGPMTACVPVEHYMAGESVFPMRMFETEKFIAPYPDYDTDYKRSFENAGIKPNVQFTTTDIYAAYCMVEAGLGCTLLNKLEVEDWDGKVRLIPVEPESSYEIGIMYPELASMSAAARTFLLQMISK